MFEVEDGRFVVRARQESPTVRGGKIVANTGEGDFVAAESWLTAPFKYFINPLHHGHSILHVQNRSIASI